MDTLEIMKRRHSVRQYSSKPIEAEKRQALNKLTEKLNAENGLHIQIMYDEPGCFDSMMAHYGKFFGVINYISLTGKKSPGLDERLGYCGEQIVLKAQELGLNTCWVAMTHGKSKAVKAKGEKELCLIALGYSDADGTSHDTKPIEQLSNYQSGMPEWFLNGMQGALLAPTAMNQQKFYFELQPDGNVTATHKTGFYTKLDLGIVKYHFEALSGKKVK